MARKIAEPLMDWIRYVELKPGAVQYIKNILPADSAIIVSGPAKTGMKTWFTFLSMLSLTTGRKHELIEPMTPDPLKVLFLEEEGAEKSTAERWRMLAKGHNVDLDHASTSLHWSHRNGALIDDASYLQDVMEYIAKFDVKVVIFDTLAQCFRGDENSARDASEINQNIKSIIKCNSGTTVMYLHHLGKTTYNKYGAISRGVDEELRGSSAFIGGYDVHWAFRRMGPERDSPLRLQVCNKEDEGFFYGLNWWFDKIGLHPDGRDKKSARLAMRELKENEVDEKVVETCLHALVPGEVYSKKGIKEQWDALMPNEVETVLDLLLNRELLLPKGRGYVVSDETPYQEPGDTSDE